jgi:peptide/nickel transport system permease protein
MTNPPEFQVTSGGAVALSTASVARKTPRQLFWERLKQDKVALAGGVTIIVLIFLALAGGPIAVAITGHGVNAQLPEGRDPFFGTPTGPSSSLWLGADGEGRDLFVRTIYGARISLFVGIVASGLALFIGLVVGLAAGFFGGIVDTILSRTADVLLAVPQILIAIGIVAACYGKNGCLGGTIQPGLSVVILVITLFSWSYIARIVRGYTLSIREKEFVESARAAGASNFRILSQEILPNLIGPLIVYATLLIPTNILFEAALSFLGLGVPDSEPTWGNILSEAQQLYNTAWWVMVFPGAFLIITTLAFNLLGDGLRDAFDVRTER